MFDLIMSFLVLVLVIALTFNYYVTGNEEIDIYTLNKNILDGFTNTKISSLNDEDIRLMYATNKIRNIENTVAQQVVEFYESPVNNALAADLTRIFIADYLDKQMNFNITIEDELVGAPYVLFSILNRPEISFENSSIVSVTQRRIFSFKNTTTFYGPYLVQIKIWK
jgi:hypothetical protein